LPQSRFVVMLRAAMELQPTNRRVRVGPVTLQVQEWDEPAFGSPPTSRCSRIRPASSARSGCRSLRRLRAGGFGGRDSHYDQRGHGLSSKPDDGYHWQSFVDDARALFRALGSSVRWASDIRRAPRCSHVPRRSIQDASAGSS
jgi:hypothetical protein